MVKPLIIDGFDFSDCVQEGPWYGEVGYVGDYLQPLEYPCNCQYCRDPKEALDKLSKEIKDMES